MDENGESDRPRGIIESARERARGLVSIPIEQGSKVTERAREGTRAIQEAEQVQEAREKLINLFRTSRNAGTRVIQEPVEVIRDIADRSLSERQQFENERKAGHIRRWLVKRGIQSFARIVIGAPVDTPIFLGLYGCGDAIAFYNAWKGKDVWKGFQKIDKVDRLINVVGGAVPMVPASWIVEAGEWIRFTFESIFAHEKSENTE